MNVGSELVGQSTNDGYDPLSTSASNLGPEDIVDNLADGEPSLLTQICARSLAVGELEGVGGSRPYCTKDGVGAVLGVWHADGATGPVTRVVSLNQACTTPFVSRYQGVAVECADPTAEYTGYVAVPVKGDAPDRPVVPADAVTASASGLDPQISVAYAELQVRRVAAERGLDPAQVQNLVSEYTSGRALGFIGEPGVDVLDLNMALDKG